MLMAIMPKLSIHPVIFTDLDGTLLDHHSYSAQPADRLIQLLSDRNLAEVVPITSKTFSELLWLKRDLPIPFSIGVTENGSVIHGPEGYFQTDSVRSQTVTMGVAYQDILDQINKLSPSIRKNMNGFSDMSVAEVGRATGLSFDDAERAKDRQATEPFLWTGSDEELAALETNVGRADIQLQRGGRFYHLTGRATKEQAMDYIIKVTAERKADSKIVAIALGDGPNDLAMIEAADVGVIMPNPEGVTITSTKPHVRTAPFPGPEGWVIAVREILTGLGLNLSES
ncbi:HAD-IIB family hydrolase [Parasphingorhabdus sp.]|uniref:HAD-IIB family hydrolase n=4 Tax=Parasphingorhabdus sp. TaxID=2709688 RepID=UPI0032671C2C